SLQDEIALNQRRYAGQLYLKIGRAVPVDITLEHAVGEPELARVRMEVGAIDVSEALMPVGDGVAIDSGKVNSVVLIVMEIDDRVVTCANNALRDIVEHEFVGILAARQRVRAQTANYAVVAATAVQRIVALATDDGIVADVPIKIVVALTADQPIGAVTGLESIVTVIAVENVTAIGEIVGETGTEPLGLE